MTADRHKYWLQRHDWHGLTCNLCLTKRGNVRDKVAPSLSTETPCLQ